jgi:hypothetical protein
MKKITIISIGVLFLTSCNPSSPGWTDLGNDYYFRIQGPLSCIIPHNLHKGPSIYPTVISFVNKKRYVFALQKPNRKEISDFLSFDMCSRFFTYDMFINGDLSNSNEELNRAIVADSLLYKLLKSKGVDTKKAANRNICSLVADSLLSTEPYREMFYNPLNYWILDKEGKKVLGPFTKDEFDIQVKKLGFEKIEFATVYKFHLWSVL